MKNILSFPPSFTLKVMKKIIKMSKSEKNVFLPFHFGSSIGQIFY